FLLSLSTSSQAQNITESIDACSAVLSESLLTKRVQQNDLSYQAGEHYWACSASSTEIQRYLTNQKTRDFKHNGNVGYEAFSIKGSWSNLRADQSSTTAIDTWKQQNCSENDSQRNATSAAFFAEQYIGSAAIEAWSKCKEAQQGLQCMARRQRNGI